MYLYYILIVSNIWNSIHSIPIHAKKCKKDINFLKYKKLMLVALRHLFKILLNSFLSKYQNIFDNNFSGSKSLWRSFPEVLLPTRPEASDPAGNVGRRWRTRTRRFVVRHFRRTSRSRFSESYRRQVGRREDGRPIRVDLSSAENDAPL